VLPAVGIALLVTFVYALLRRRRRRTRAAHPAPGESELMRLYERLQKRAGRRRAPPETPLEYLRWAEQPQVLRDVTDAVNEGAYAGRWPDPARVRELSDRLS
jgi:hypothetical protein